MKTDVQVNFVINGINKKYKNIGYLLLTANTLPYQKISFDFPNKSIN